jgi:hypothetical protein
MRRRGVPLLKPRELRQEARARSGPRRPASGRSGLAGHAPVCHPNAPYVGGGAPSGAAREGVWRKPWRSLHTVAPCPDLALRTRPKESGNGSRSLIGSLLSIASRNGTTAARPTLTGGRSPTPTVAPTTHPRSTVPARRSRPQAPAPAGLGRGSRPYTPLGSGAAHQPPVSL